MEVVRLLWDVPSRQDYDRIDILLQGEPHAGREATAPSIVIRKREVQRREETPPNGGVVTPEDIQMQPFIPKGKLNSILNF
jgi:hypothetical protein